MIHAQLDVAWVIAMCFGGLAALLLVVGVPAMVIGFFTDSDGIALPLGMILSVIGAIIAIIVGLVTFPPFESQYHTYVPISGIVQNVGSRFLSDGNGGTNQKFTVEINGQVYGVNDSRASQLHKGSAVTILCEKTFQFNGTPGWDCNWGKFGLNK